MPRRSTGGQVTAMASATPMPPPRPAAEIRAAQINAVRLATSMWPDDPDAPREILEAPGLLRRTGLETTAG